VPAPSDPPRPVDAVTDEHDTPMTAIYVAVVVVEAIILALLWLLGRVYT
jgi:hypothetical protein